MLSGSRRGGHEIRGRVRAAQEKGADVEEEGGRERKPRRAEKHPWMQTDSEETDRAPLGVPRRELERLESQSRTGPFKQWGSIAA